MFVPSVLTVVQPASQLVPPTGTPVVLLASSSSTETCVPVYVTSGATPLRAIRSTVTALPAILVWICPLAALVPVSTALNAPGVVAGLLTKIRTMSSQEKSS